LAAISIRNSLSLLAPDDVNAQPQGVFEGVVGRRVGQGKEIICLSSDDSGRLALGARDGIVQAFTVGFNGELSCIFSVLVEDIVPIAVSFVDNTAKDVTVIGMYCGQK
jgi:hypothetical protein